MPELILDPYSSLAEADAGKVVGWDGHPYIVTALAPLDHRTPDTGGAVFPKIRPDASQSYRIYRADPGVAQLVTSGNHRAGSIQHPSSAADGPGAVPTRLRTLPIS